MSLQGPPFEVVTRILLLYSCVFGPRWSTKSTFWRFQHADNEMASRRSVPGLPGRNVRPRTIESEPCRLRGAFFPVHGTSIQSQLRSRLQGSLHWARRAGSLVLFGRPRLGKLHRLSAGSTHGSTH